MWVKPVVVEVGLKFQQPEEHMCSPDEVVPGSWDPGSGGLHRLLGARGCVHSDLFLHTGFFVAAAAALGFHAPLCV